MQQFKCKSSIFVVFTQHIHGFPKDFLHGNFYVRYWNFNHHEFSRMQILKGGCHCGRIQFEVTVPKNIVVQECNCSICSRSAYIHLIVPNSRFKLLQGRENLTTYTFDTHEAKHLFCKTCGIKSFYVPRSNPDGYSINLRCLDNSKFEKITVELFDGKHWEENAHTLQHLSKD